MSFVKSNIWFYFRTYQDTNTLFTCNVDIPKYIINSPLYRVIYNYAVIHESSEVTWEQAPCVNGTSEIGTKRFIPFRSEDLVKGKMSSDN